MPGDPAHRRRASPPQAATATLVAMQDSLRPGAALAALQVHGLWPLAPLIVLRLEADDLTLRKGINSGRFNAADVDENVFASVGLGI
jgi:hypothetical protein